MCKCNVLINPATSDNKNTIDRDSSIICINNYTTNRSIEIKLKYLRGLSSFKVCNSDDCSEYYSICYKLKGYYEYVST